MTKEELQEELLKFCNSLSESETTEFLNETFRQMSEPQLFISVGLKRIQEFTKTVKVKGIDSVLNSDSFMMYIIEVLQNSYINLIEKEVERFKNK